MIPEPLSVRDVVFLGQAFDLLKGKFNQTLDELNQSKEDYYDLLELHRRKLERVDINDEPQGKGKGLQETNEERLMRLYMTALRKIGLLTETHIPLPFDDSEFLRRVNDIVATINTFSRHFTKSKLTMPVIYNLEHIKFLNPAFGPLTEQGTKKLVECLGPRHLSWRLVNIIMLRGLSQRYFIFPPMGIPLHSDEDIAIKVLLRLFHGSDKEIHRWKAQTVHLLSKRVELVHFDKSDLVPCLEFKECLDREIKNELELIWSELEPYANPPEEKVPQLKIELENIIRMMAELGVLFSRITEWNLQPMAPYSVKVGQKYDRNYMELMDEASEAVYEGNPDAPVTCVMNAPWRKATFTQSGETTVDEGIFAIIKARVSLVNYGLSPDPKDGDVMPSPVNDGLDAWGSISEPLPPLRLARVRPSR